MKTETKPSKKKYYYSNWNTLQMFETENYNLND